MPKKSDWMVLFLMRLINQKYVEKKKLFQRFRDFTREEQKLGKKVYHYLVHQKQWIREIKSKYGIDVSVNPKKAKEIKKWLFD